MENKVIKNMEYWKKKNNIPGIEALADSGLTDGRAGSSAFQMATPGSSPNKFIGGMVKNIGQGLMGKGKMGFLNPAMWAARGVKNTLDADPTTTNVFGGGTGDQAFGGVFGGGQPQVPQPAMAAQPQVHQPPLAMKSPLEQEDRPDPTYEGTDYQGPKEGVLGGQEIAKQNENFELDEENGRLMTTEQFGGEEGILINDPNDILEGRTLGDDDFDYRYKVEEDGSYTLISKGPTGGVKSPSEENVPTGPMGPGGMGGVGEIKAM